MARENNLIKSEGISFAFFKTYLAPNSTNVAKGASALDISIRKKYNFLKEAKEIKYESFYKQK